MNELLLVLVGVAVSVPATRLTDRWRFRTERRARAADELANHTHRLELLVVQADPGMVDPEEFCEAMVRWDEVWNQYYADLPEHWVSLGRSVRSAVGEFTGLPAMAAFDRNAWTIPLAEYSGTWQTNAEFYLRYVRFCLRRLAHARRPGGFANFDEWLRNNSVLLSTVEAELPSSTLSRLTCRNLSSSMRRTPTHPVEAKVEPGPKHLADPHSGLTNDSARWSDRPE